ncbi:hypothetical protein BH09DEP1_BH09DEP1_4020 [soil metagenome]
MIKQLVCVALIASPMHAMDFQARMNVVHSIPGIPSQEAIPYLDAIEDMQEIDPKTGEVFAWLDVVDYECFKHDATKADIVTRFKCAIVTLAHRNKMPAKDILQAQALVNQDARTLHYIFTGNHHGQLDPAQWYVHWSAIKKEIKQSAIEADTKIILPLKAQ